MKKLTTRLYMLPLSLLVFWSCEPSSSEPEWDNPVDPNARLSSSLGQSSSIESSSTDNSSSLSEQSSSVEISSSTVANSSSELSSSVEASLSSAASSSSVASSSIEPSSSVKTSSSIEFSSSSLASSSSEPSSSSEVSSSSEPSSSSELSSSSGRTLPDANIWDASTMENRLNGKYNSVEFNGFYGTVVPNANTVGFSPSDANQFSGLQVDNLKNGYLEIKYQYHSKDDEDYQRGFEFKLFSKPTIETGILIKRDSVCIAYAMSMNTNGGQPAFLQISSDQYNSIDQARVKLSNTSINCKQEYFSFWDFSVNNKLILPILTVDDVVKKATSLQILLPKGGTENDPYDYFHLYSLGFGDGSCSCR